MKKNGLKIAVITAFLFLGWHTHVLAKTKPATAAHDIRILIDVSGSMKRNDPGNLRIPALRLLANLLPSNAQAGVWTFGRHVNMLVPLSPVDKQWKRRATKAAGTIRSNGLFTNIEETLQKSTWDWKQDNPEIERTIILLTDGLVDIDKDANKNRASRDNIINNIVPRLARSGATVHTIALSGEADELLLQQLAASSNGWYEKAKDAEGLERIFFRMFEKTTQPDTLPLIENKVIVDSSINEMTLLIFNRNDAQPPMVTTPEDKVFGRNSPPQNVSWHHQSRYDLITITNPASGTWYVDADTDPDNRVMVVTDLKLVTTSFPNNIYLDDEQYYFASLANENKVITKPAFHRFVDIKLQQTHKENQTRHKLKDDGDVVDQKAKDGTYSINLSDALTEGQHELITQVDGVTFKREKRHLINVYASPVITKIKPEKILDAEIETLFVIPRADMINPDSINMMAIISDSAGEVQRIDIPRSSHNEWKLPLGNFSSDQQHSVTIKITGIRPNGRPVESRVGPISFGAQTQPAEVIRTPDTNELTPIAAAEVTSDNEVNWIAISIPFVMFNLLLGGGIFFGYKKWKARPKSAQEKPWEALAHE
ncbi:MAG: VWA domain-containing protein [Gammaproteobacteria bacterium]|nr:VWA domain-containing protein [Gammaproteobacteria bacterium]